VRPESNARFAPPKRVAEIGELGLLARIAARVGPADGSVLVGIGDDTAALRPRPGALVLLTTDALVEDVHFRRAASSAADVGWKALAINASDIAAMGGTPSYAVVSLMLPGDTEAAWVDGLYDGLLAMAGEAGITVVGGNLAQAPVVIIDVALLGDVEPDRLVRRSGARPGDLLAVTGTLGRAAAGLIALTQGMMDAAPPGAPVVTPPPDSRQALVARAIAAQRRPWPRLAAGRLLAASGAVRAMIDLSDGLRLDLWRVCEASGVGVRIDASRVPVDPCAAVVADAAGRDALDLALSGGEDYELLFAVDPNAAARVLDRLAAETGLAAAIIGQFTQASAGRLILVDGVPAPLEPEGWTHFRGEGR
jgi:thiamine-monophosphate kinase